MPPKLAKFRVAMLRCVAGLIVVSGLVATACSYSRRRAEAVPEAALYPNPVSFAGRWEGNIGDQPGELRLQEESKERYQGAFSAWQVRLSYELTASRDRVSDPERGRLRPGNRLIFDWKDDKGSRGRGWLLISPDGRVMTGEFGFGDSAIGAGDWSFTRAKSKLR